MELKLFEALGKIAGLAGISIGLVLLVFRQVLKAGKFPKLNTDQAYKVIRDILYLTTFIAVVGIAAWLVSSMKISAHTITGHVMEKETKKPISGAEIILSGRTEASQTDGAGNFSIPFLNPPVPTGPVHMFISKDGYDEFDRDAELGQNIEASMVPSKPKTESPVQPPAKAADLVVDKKPETYLSDNSASGACKDFGAWASVCSPDKPAGWSIAYQSFELTGDRKCGAWSHCEPVGTPTETKVCYRFNTQGHDEECGHSGNTGIHYSQGVLTVLWKHP